MIKKRRIFLVLLILLTLLTPIGGWWYCQHYYTGPRSGVVVDAVTGKPIEGAVVCMLWNTSGLFTISGSALAAAYEIETDAEGKYDIPSQRYARSHWLEAVHPEDVMIYKDGYCAYKVTVYSRDVGRSYGHKDAPQPYQKQKNKARLFPLGEADSHKEHFEWVRVFGIHSWPEELLIGELQEEQERARKEKSFE